ncbi:GerMN domain-containing protein [Ktedonobacteria bacterium brp13]|nr:GerMN domain-containing protein [Ktedonobacteria bacterium brp13]
MMFYAQQNGNQPIKKTLTLTAIITALLVTFLLLTSACSPSQAIAQPISIAPTSPRTQTATITSPTPKATATGQYHVKIYFSKTTLHAGQAGSDIAVPVERLTNATMIETYAMQQLVQGPTATEQKEGYYSQLQRSIAGPSNCNSTNSAGSTDFILTLNKKGSIAESGTATVKFCRHITSAGVGADATINSEIVATLEQFNIIKKVVILTNEGHCFGDESGADVCLH